MASPPQASGPLAAAVIALAGTPDHAPHVRALLVRVPRLTVERVAAATYASVTGRHGHGYTTVAVSDDLIREIDDIQYAENAGPCVESVSAGHPVGVPDIDATVQWPGFHEAAPRMGLHASVSVPLHTGRGDITAVLNVYGRDRTAMAPLITGICLAHDHPAGLAHPAGHPAALDAGGRELVDGYAGALRVRATIRRALELIGRELGCGADDAYLTLCLRAYETGTGLAETAAGLAGPGTRP